MGEAAMNSICVAILIAGFMYIIYTLTIANKHHNTVNHPNTYTVINNTNNTL
jgi:hypothetical protein